jgi:hypothetical protein
MGRIEKEKIKDEPGMLQKVASQILHMAQDATAGPHRLMPQGDACHIC